MINNYDITDRFGPINSDYTYKFMGISNSSLEKLKKDTNVEWIKKDTFPKGFKDPSVFPKNHHSIGIMIFMDLYTFLKKIHQLN